MINHVRTLLLNTEGELIPAGAALAEAYIPTYKPVVLDTPLQEVYQRLYGTDPDYEGKLYRTAQYLGVLHRTEFAEYVTAFDSRITYDPGHPGLFLQTYGTQISTTGFAKLTLLGTWQQTGYKGRMRADWVVLLNGTQVTVRHVQTGYSDTSILLFADDGASGRFPLLQSDFEAIIVAPGVVVPQRWDILHRDALSQDLGLVLDDLTNMSAASQIALFGTSSAEPYASFRNLFEHGKILPLRLSGVLLALAYRMEAVRNP